MAEETQKGETLKALQGMSEAIGVQTRMLGQLLNSLNGLFGIQQSQAGMGQLVPSPGVEVTEDWLVLPFDVGTLAGGTPGAIVPISLTIGKSGHFDLVKITHTATNNNFQIRILSGDSDKYLSQNPTGGWVHILSLSGSAQLPYMILGKRRFVANESVTIEARDIGGAGNTNVQVVMHGIRVYL